MSLKRWINRAYSDQRIEDYYQRRAEDYHNTDNKVNLLGYKPRIALRQRTIEHANLQPGDRVLDIGCGTGANFPFILERIGKTGSLVGVDFSQPMLDVGQAIIDREGWQNVQLMQADAAQLDVGETFDVVLSVMAMVVIPDWVGALEKAYAHVRPGGMLVIADLGESQRRGMSLVNPIMRGVDRLLITDTRRHPWERIAPHLEDYQRSDLLLGYMYVASGRKPQSAASINLR